MKKVLRIGIAVICMVCLVVGYYTYLSRRNDSARADENVELSEVQAIISKNFKPIIMSKDTMVVSVERTTVIGYYH